MVPASPLSVSVSDPETSSSSQDSAIGFFGSDDAGDFFCEETDRLASEDARSAASWSAWISRRTPMDMCRKGSAYTFVFGDHCTL